MIFKFEDIAANEMLNNHHIRDTIRKNTLQSKHIMDTRERIKAFEVGVSLEEHTKENMCMRMGRILYEENVPLYTSQEDFENGYTHIKAELVVMKPGELNKLLKQYALTVINRSRELQEEELRKKETE